jgi:hypothetical protein
MSCKRSRTLEHLVGVGPTGPVGGYPPHQAVMVLYVIFTQPSLYAVFQFIYCNYSNELGEAYCTQGALRVRSAESARVNR